MKRYFDLLEEYPQIILYLLIPGIAIIFLSQKLDLSYNLLLFGVALCLMPLLLIAIAILGVILRVLAEFYIEFTEKAGGDKFQSRLAGTIIILVLVSYFIFIIFLNK